jgi:hypothetical protein
MFADKSLLQLSYDEFGQQGGDGLMFGLPAAITGISLYSNVNSPISNPVHDANMLFGSVLLDRAKNIGATVGAAIDHWRATGEHPGRSPQVRDTFVRAFAPTTIYRALAAANDGAIRSLSSGYPLMTGVSAGEQILYGFGFNPTSLERELAVVDQLYSNQESRRGAVSRMGEAFQGAFLQGDSEQMQAIIRSSAVMGLDPSSIIASAKARLAKTQEGIIGRTFRPQDVVRYRSVLQD